MKVHFFASKEFVRNNLRLAEFIVDTVRGKADISADWLRQVTRLDPKHNDEKEPEEIYQEEIKSIKDSDAVIAEVSIRSLGVGFQISYALSKNKQVLCLYDLRLGAKAVSHLLTGSTEKALFLWGYDPMDRKSLKKKVEEFLERSGNLKMEKFNFIATQEIKKYIKWASRQQNVSESEFLRQILGNLINNDPEYSGNL